MRVGGCPAVMAQWQSTDGSSQRCPVFDLRWAAGLFHFPLFSPHNIQIHLLFSYYTHNEFVVYTVLMLVLALDSGILVLEQCWSPHLQNTNSKKRKKENGDVNCYTNASVEMSVLFTCSAEQSLIILVKTQGSKFKVQSL